MNIAQDIDFELAQIHRLAHRMDALIRIPGTKITLGFDSLLGLIPGVGDVLALAPAVWMINKARHLGAQPGTLAYMTLNAFLDFLIGLIPVAGDVFDALYSANIRNFKALERDLNRKTARAKPVRTAELSLDFATS